VFGYRHHKPVAKAALPPELQECMRMFGSLQSRGFVERLSGLDCGGDVQINASLFLPGDFLSLHDDSSPGRTLAFVWNLTRRWDPTWGGQFFWCRPPVSVCPTFNTMVLFAVQRDRSVHGVQPVQPLTRSRRLAITGWWTARASVAAAPDPPLRKAPPFWPDNVLTELGSGIFVTREPGALPEDPRR
jgi:hypothetical protein